MEVKCPTCVNESWSHSNMIHHAFCHGICDDGRKPTLQVSQYSSVYPISPLCNWHMACVGRRALLHIGGQESVKAKKRGHASLIMVQLVVNQCCLHLCQLSCKSTHAAALLNFWQLPNRHNNQSPRFTIGQDACLFVYWLINLLAHSTDYWLQTTIQPPSIH